MDCDVNVLILANKDESIMIHLENGINPSLGRCAAPKSPAGGEPWRRAVQLLNRMANMRVKV